MGREPLRFGFLRHLVRQSRRPFNRPFYAFEQLGLFHCERRRRVDWRFAVMGKQREPVTVVLFDGAGYNLLGAVDVAIVVHVRECPLSVNQVRGTAIPTYETTAAIQTGQSEESAAPFCTGLSQSQFVVCQAYANFRRVAVLMQLCSCGGQSVLTRLSTVVFDGPSRHVSSDFTRIGVQITC